VLIVLLCMCVDSLMACSAAFGDVTGAAVPSAVRDGMGAVTALAAAIAYAIHLRRAG
jgi:hypothetical protein